MRFNLPLVGNEHRHMTPDFWFPVLLIAAGVLFFADPLFSARNFYFRDILNFHFPLRKVLIESYARGEIPLWNPYIHLGQPMLANPNYLAFYPTNLLHLLLPFNYAFKLHFIVHPILAGLGLYFFERRLGIRALAAFSGSLVYQFSGTVLSFMNLYNMVPAVALLPWIAWSFQGALMEKWWRRSLLFGGLLGLQVLALEPLLFQCCLVLVAGLAALHLLESGNKGRAAKEALRICVVGASFAFAVAAVQIFPSFEMLAQSARGAGYSFDSASFASMHPADLLNTMIPSLFGNIYVINNPYYWGELFHGARESYLVSYFIGSPAIILCILSLVSSRGKLVAVLTGLLLSSVVLALGKFTPFFGLLHQYLSFFRLGRYPSKYFLLATLALAVLASVGVEVALEQHTHSPGRRKVIAVSVVGLLLALALWGVVIHWQSSPQQQDSWLRANMDADLVTSKDLPAIRSQLVGSVRNSAIYLCLASFLILAPILGKPSALPGFLLFLALAASLVPENLRLLPLASEEVMDFVPEVNRYIALVGPREPFRVSPPTLFRPITDLRLKIPSPSIGSLNIFYRKSGQAVFGILNGIQYSLDRSLDQLNTIESEELWRGCVNSPQSVGIMVLQKLNSPVFLSLDDMQDPSLRLLTAFETDSDRKVQVYWLENTLPRAYFVSGIEHASSRRNALERILHPEFPFRDTVILEDSHASNRPGRAGSGRVSILAYESNRILCDVEARDSGHVVLLDSYYPGWRAFLNGKEVEILRANYAFRAVGVTAGRHRLEFVYQPRSFYAGLSVTSSALLLGLASMIWKRAGGFLGRIKSSI